MGAVLSQEFSYERDPVAYASRATKDAEKRYSAFLLELVCVKWAFEKYQKFIFGRPLHLVTDCEAIAGILSKQTVSAAHTRWREFILAHDIVRFTHRAGEKNVAADLLSRRRNNTVEATATTPDPTIPDNWDDYLASKQEVRMVRKAVLRIENEVKAQGLNQHQPQSHTDHEEKEAQFSDKLLREHVYFLENHLSQNALRKRMQGDEQFEELSEFLLSLSTPKGASPQEVGRLRETAKDFFIAEDGAHGRECIPKREQTALIDGVHEQLNHAGRDRVLAHLHRRFFWRNMPMHVSKRIASCARCQQFGHQVFRSKLQPVTVLRPMQLLSMDYFSLKATKGYKTVLVIVDYFSRFTWAYKFKTAGTARTTVDALQDLTRNFGDPENLISDNGSHLANAAVAQFCEERGIRRSTTPVYSPHTNGLIERTNATILKALETACAASSFENTNGSVDGLARDSRSSDEQMSGQLYGIQTV
jgi:transposase InsO family protein